MGNDHDVLVLNEGVAAPGYSWEGLCFTPALCNVSNQGSVT